MKRDLGDRALNEGEAISPRAIFDEAFPYYLAIGMSADLYWDGRPELVIPYRKADILRQKCSNNDAWLQGVYIRQAVASVLDKKAKYPKAPFDIGENLPTKSGMTVKQEKAKAAFAAFAKQCTGRRLKRTLASSQISRRSSFQISTKKIVFTPTLVVHTSLSMFGRIGRPVFMSFPKRIKRWYGSLPTNMVLLSPAY